MQKFGNKKIAVIGDIMLDQFLEGVNTRKSPEANAPIVLLKEEKKVLGGAANVAMNIASLGGSPYLFSVVGSDTAGQLMRGLLLQAGIKNHLIIDKKRVSTVKTRVFDNEKYLLRLDKETSKPLSKKLTKQLVAEILSRLSHFDAIAFSDYNKGLFTKELTRPIITEAKKRGIPTVADIKPENLACFKGVTILKPNLLEALIISGAEDEISAAKIISKKIHSDILVTLGGKGMIFYDNKHDKLFKIKGIQVEKVGIIGAGDVASACVALGLASGVNGLQSATLANKAAALSVEKFGTTVVTIRELRRDLRQ